MKYRRSVKLYFKKWLTKAKLDELQEIREEFARIQTYFAENYEDKIPEQTKYTLIHAEYIQKCIKDTNTFLSARMVKQAFAEAYGAISSAKHNMERRNNTYYRPSFRGKRILLSECSIKLEDSSLKKFDLMAKLYCLRTDKGNKYKLYVPLKKHRMYNYWNEYKDEFNPDGGKRSTSAFLTDSYIQFFWSFESGPKKTEGEMVGIDFGMHTLLTLSNGVELGTNILQLVEEIRRKKQFSRGWYKKKAEIKEYIDKCIKEINFDNKKLIVIEDLRGIKKARGRLAKSVRSVLYNISTWQIRLRLQHLCEKNRVSFHRMPPFYTSQECVRCGHIEKANRISRDDFVCQKCGHSDKADLNASKVILKRHVLGKYGSQYKQEYLDTYYPVFASD